MHINTEDKNHFAADAEFTPEQKLQEVENLTNELKRLLVHNELALDEEGVRREVEILERWMESYRRGLAAATKISETGVEWLVQLRNRLKHAADERQRLEGEGGNPPTNEQMHKTEALMEAVRRLDKAIPGIEQAFSPAPVHENT